MAYDWYLRSIIFITLAFILVLHTDLQGWAFGVHRILILGSAKPVVAANSARMCVYVRLWPAALSKRSGYKTRKLIRLRLPTALLSL